MEPTLLLLAGLAAGAAAGWLIQQMRMRVKLAENDRGHQEGLTAMKAQHLEETTLRVTEHRERAAGLQGQLEQAASAEKLMQTAKEQMSQAFEATAAKALNNNNEQFLVMAQENLGKTMEAAKGELQQRHEHFENLVKPLAENYQKLDPGIESLMEMNRSLTAETSRLATALRDNRQAGSWGEVQLRRVVELAGMTQYCDFTEQQTADGGAERPDLTIRLPGGHAIVVDAKASLQAFLEAQEEEEDDKRAIILDRHARALRTQVDDLNRKSYGTKVEGARDFVVMFVPGDQFLSAALSASPGLVEYAMSKRVAIATPASLISLLWTAYGGWQRQELAENAEGIRKAGEDFHQSMQTFISHYADAGKNLERAVDSYNKSVASFDSRVTPRGRRFAGLAASDENAYKELTQIDTPVSGSKQLTLP